MTGATNRAMETRGEDWVRTLTDAYYGEVSQLEEVRRARRRCRNPQRLAQLRWQMLSTRYYMARVQKERRVLRFLGRLGDGLMSPVQCYSRLAGLTWAGIACSACGCRIDGMKTMWVVLNGTAKGYCDLCDVHGDCSAAARRDADVLRKGVP